MTEPQVKLETGYMDLSIFDDYEKCLYDCEKWTTQIPIILKRRDDTSFFIDTNADCIEYIWVNIEVTVNNTYRPVKNLAHNLFKNIAINTSPVDLNIWRTDNYVLDFLANFNADAEYMKNINLPKENLLSEWESEHKYKLCFPLPLSTPIFTDVLTQTTLYIKYELREILGIENVKIDMYANYRLVNEKMRSVNRTKPRRMMIETYEIRPIEIVSSIEPCFDLRFSSTKAILFAAKVKDEFSEYRNIFDRVGLAYGEAIRLWQPMSFYTFIQPHFHAKVNNGEPIGLYSYANGKINDIDTFPSISLHRFTSCSLLPKVKPEFNPKEYEFVCVAIVRNVWYANPFGGHLGLLTL